MGDMSIAQYNCLMKIQKKFDGCPWYELSAWEEDFLENLGFDDDVDDWREDAAVEKRIKMAAGQKGFFRNWNFYPTAKTPREKDIDKRLQTIERIWAHGPVETIHYTPTKVKGEPNDSRQT